MKWRNGWNGLEPVCGFELFCSAKLCLSETPWLSVYFLQGSVFKLEAAIAVKILKSWLILPREKRDSLGKISEDRGYYPDTAEHPSNIPLL